MYNISGYVGEKIMKLRVNKVFYLSGSILIIVLAGLMIFNLSIYKPNFDLGALISYESQYLNFNESSGYIFIEPKINSNTDKGVVFYPGAMVEEKSYIPLLVELSKGGYGVYIVKSLFHLPILNQNAAESIIAEGRFDDYILIGHSLGGASLLKYLSKETELSKKIKNVVLLASYSDGSHVFDNDINVLSMVGSNDKVINIEEYENDKQNLPSGTKYITIDGGNHAYYGNYGNQRKDGEATISIEQQQYVVLSEIEKFINESR